MGKKFKKWHYCNIYPTAKIGDGTKIGSYTEIGENVKIGKNCTISSYVFTCEGVEIEDNVFIGPRVTFFNDKNPPSNKKEWKRVLIKKGAVIGGSVIILPGVTIGENAFVGAGSLITKDIPANEMWFGSPAIKYKNV